MRVNLILIYFSAILVIFLSAFGTIAFAQSSETEIQNTSKLINDEDIRYISDELFIYLRSGPGKGYRLLGSINAGSRVTLLNVDREAGYAEVIDERQRTGWVEVRFVSRMPSIRYQLEDMQNVMLGKDEKMAKMQFELDAVKVNLAQSDKNKAGLNRQLTQQLEENARLNEIITQRERANNMQWFTRGAILAGSSVLVGYLMGLFGRKRNKNDRLM